MPKRILATMLVAAAVAVAAEPVHAQRTRDTEPRRPSLAASADTNDASAYYAYGRSRLKTNPGDAANAFYWAMRLDPTKAEPYYARRTALLMQNPQRLVRYMGGDRRTMRHQEVVAADSLYRIALGISPLLYREFDRDMLHAYLMEWGDFGQLRAAGVSEKEILHEMEKVLARAGTNMRGWMAYAERRLPEAADEWALALRRARSKAPLLFDRAEVFYLMGRGDSAAVQAQAALAEVRKTEDDVYVYRSKAYYELALGMIQESRDRQDEAMEAYGRALQEDLSYHPAHRRMAQLALARHDTATAVATLALGAAMDGADAALRFEYATLLFATRQYDEAADHARKLVEAEPYFAGGHALLGRTLEAQGDRAGALACYEQYLARARRGDQDRRTIDARVRSLREAAGTP